MITTESNNVWTFPSPENEKVPGIGDFITLDETFIKHVRACAPRAHVLIEGETGTGKEVLAKLIHELGGNRGSFVVVDCAALPETLAEAELFGHIRGAFTGCYSDRAGLLEQAHGGSVFLDEIADLPSILQGRLLRFLQEGQIRRLGQAHYRKVSSRVIAASNRNLDHEIQAGRFRKDLFYRLRRAHLTIAPLRDRSDDLQPIAKDLFNRNAVSQAKHFIVVDAVLELLLGHDWPGNVRELQCEIENAVASLDHRDAIGREHFPRLNARRTARPYDGAPRCRYRQIVPGESDLASPPLAAHSRSIARRDQQGLVITDGELPLPSLTEPCPDGGSDGPTLDQAIKSLILERLSSNNWDYRKTWQSLKMPRSTFYAKLKRYGIRKGSAKNCRGRLR